MKFKEFLGEQKDNHAVLAFGRMNPPTTGHEVLVNKVKEVAKNVGGTHHVVLSHSQDKDKNPLTAAQKVKHAKRYFSDTNITVANKEHPNFLSQASELHKKGVTHLHMVAGSDRVGEYKKILNKYNGVKGPHGHFKFKHIEVHSAGERDPDAEGTSGMSASKMRAHASAGEFHHFKKGIPSHVPDHHAKELYNDVRKGMNIKESLDESFEDFLDFIVEGVHDKGIFKAVFLGGGPGSGKDYVLSKTLDGHGLIEINSDKALEFLMDKKNLDMRMPDNEKEARDVVRGKAKSMTELKQRLALFGRNGIIINGTGDSPEKIKKIKDRLDQIGYESSMIMVNTRDEVSSARNVERGQRGGRTVPEDIRKSKWQDVQNARPELAKLFGDNYNEIDNSEDLRKADPQVRASKEKEFIELYKNINKFIAKPPKNDVSKEWIASELQKKDTAPIPKGESSIEPHPDSGAAQQAKEMGLQYYGFGRYGKNGKVTHRSIHDKLTDVSQTIRTTVKEDVISEAVTFSITGDTPEEVNALFTKMFNSEKQKEQNENTSFSNSNAINMLTLGKKYSVEENRTDSVTLTNADIENILENKKDTYLKDENDKIRVFMLRASAAKESHHINGLVVPNKVTKQGGYIIKINEENQNVSIHQEPVFVKEDGTDNTNQSFRGKITLSEIRSRSFSKNNNRTGLISEETGRSDESGGYEDKQTPAAKSLNWRERKSTTGFEELRAKQKQKLQKESIDKGIETGLSMAGAGESIGRDMGEKIRKKEIKPTVVEMQGDETTASIGAQKEDELKKVGINLQSFKAKRPIG